MKQLAGMDFGDPQQLAALLGKMGFKGYENDDDDPFDQQSRESSREIEFNAPPREDDSMDGEPMPAGGMGYGHVGIGAPLIRPASYNPDEDPAQPAMQAQPTMQAQLLDDDESLPELTGQNDNFFKMIRDDGGAASKRGSADENVVQVDENGRRIHERSFGDRVNGFFKGAKRMAQGVWEFGKNISGYNLLRHGLVGANFRRGKLNKNLAKWKALGETDEERWKHKDAMMIDHKMLMNRMHLMNHRYHYTGYKMANYFRRGAGKEMLQREALPRFVRAGLAPSLRLRALASNAED